MSFSSVPYTVPTVKRRERKRAPSPVAWERVLDRLRKKLRVKLTRSDVFGLAGHRNSKILWCRRQPDLRMSVLVSLARVLKVSPGKYLDLICEEQAKMDREKAKFHAKLTRKVAAK